MLLRVLFCGRLSDGLSEDVQRDVFSSRQADQVTEKWSIYPLTAFTGRDAGKLQ